MKHIGWAVTGSFCTLDAILPGLTALIDAGYEVTPIISEVVRDTDTRFTCARDFRERLETICGRSCIDTQTAAEPIGPRKLLDALIVAPCTGNTLAKLSNGIADSTVTLACKAHLRNNRPLIIAVSTNDALAGNASNIGHLMARRNVYFVPLQQDDALQKPCSCVADFAQIHAALNAALQGEQLQPILF